MTELDKIFAEQEDLFGDVEDDSCLRHEQSAMDDESEDEESEYAWFE